MNVTEICKIDHIKLIPYMCFHSSLYYCNHISEMGFLDSILVRHVQYSILFAKDTHTSRNFMLMWHFVKVTVVTDARIHQALYQDQDQLGL
jgi:hypothetical protein